MPADKRGDSPVGLKTPDWMRRLVEGMKTWVADDAKLRSVAKKIFLRRPRRRSTPSTQAGAAIAGYTRSRATKILVSAERIIGRRGLDARQGGSQ